MSSDEDRWKIADYLEENPAMAPSYARKAVMEIDSMMRREGYRFPNGEVFQKRVMGSVPGGLIEVSVTVRTYDAEDALEEMRIMMD